MCDLDKMEDSGIDSGDHNGSDIQKGHRFPVSSFKKTLQLK